MANSPKVKMRVAIKRNVGNEEIIVDFDGGEIPLSSAMLNFDLLAAKAQECFNHYITHYAAKSRTTGEQSAAVGQGDGAARRGGEVEYDYKLVPVDRLTVKVEGGKYLPRVACGEWQKHGLIIYPEVLKPHKFTPQAIPLEGGLDLSGWTAKVGMKSDGVTPTKVLELIPPDRK